MPSVSTNLLPLSFGILTATKNWKNYYVLCQNISNLESSLVVSIGGFSAIPCHFLESMIGSANPDTLLPIQWFNCVFLLLGFSGSSCKGIGVIGEQMLFWTSGFSFNSGHIVFLSLPLRSQVCPLSWRDSRLDLAIFSYCAFVAPLKPINQKLYQLVQ